MMMGTCVGRIFGCDDSKCSLLRVLLELRSTFVVGVYADGRGGLDGAYAVAPRPGGYRQEHSQL